MPEPYAEVIGDPIAHSLSPAIHGRWIAALLLEARYQASRVTAAELVPFLDRRRRDPDWRGCNVTAPHKRAVAGLVDRLTPAAERIGAVNCVFREGGLLIGDNTDVTGIAAALGGTGIAGSKAVIIGAGGAAAPAVDHLLGHGATEIVLLARQPARAEPLRLWAPDRVRIAPMESDEVADARLVINATPLGMSGGPAMPRSILQAIGGARDATIFDMVYRPARTELLAAAEAAGLRAVGGFDMLVGQARPSFERFFGMPAPCGEDAALRQIVASA
jgi:shikimate dehydrogenase